MTANEEPVELARQIDLDLRTLAKVLHYIPRAEDKAEAAAQFKLLHAKTAYLVKRLGGVPIED